jgi:hypothetical protein
MFPKNEISELVTEGIFVLSTPSEKMSVAIKKIA